jgi:uncharacterized protein (TIGR00106 family)
MLAAFSITPLGAGESVGEQVAEAVRIVRASGLPSETNAMFTNVEGEWDEVMAAIRACIDKVAEAAPPGDGHHQGGLASRAARRPPGP